MQPITALPGRNPRRPSGRRWSAFCWVTVAPGVGWAAARLVGLDRGAFVQLLAFTPYAAVGTLIPVLLALALRRRAATALAALVSLTLFALVVPRALGTEQPPVAGPGLRVLTANLLVGGADPAALVALVRAERVDLLALQEFTPGAQHALDRLGLADLLPYRQVNPEPTTTGSGLYSRFPLTETGVRRNGGGFSQAYATVRVPGAPDVPVESAHPAAPYSPAVVGDWRADLAAQPPADPDGPTRILAGDFNATLDHGPLRALLRTGYVDAAAAVGAGLTGTWGPYDGDPIPPVAIDHVLVDRRIAVRAVTVHRLAGSDHRAVLAELRLPAA